MDIGSHFFKMIPFFEEIFMKHGSKSVTKKSLFCLCAFTAALSFGCNDSKQAEDTNNDDEKFVFSTYRSHSAVTNHFEMNSQAGCALDSDCQDGMFCFLGLSPAARETRRGEKGRPAWGCATQEGGCASAANPSKTPRSRQERFFRRRFAQGALLPLLPVQNS